MRARWGHPGFAYLTAVVATAAVVLMRRFALGDAFGHDAPLYLFLFAVMVAAWHGGLAPGLLATALGAAAGTFFFIEGNGWRVTHLADRLRIGLFAAVGVALSCLAEALHRSRSRADQGRESLRVTLKSIGDAVITTDTEGRVTSLNPVAVALTGWAQDEAAGRPLEQVFRIINERTRRAVENPVQKVLAVGRVVGLANHTILVAKDGTERPIDDSAAPIRDAAGQVRGTVLIFRDITERRRVERMRSQLAAIVESSDDAIIGKDLAGTITSWNQGAERLYGYAAEEVVGRPLALLVPPGHADEVPSLIERIKRGERVEHFETVRVRKDGGRVDVSLTISPVRDAEGRVVGASKIARDITARRRAEEQLRLAGEQLRLADRKKDEFLATLAHELRNPLAPLRNGLQIFRLRGDDPNTVAQARTVMERQFQQLVRLIDDLLDVSRITRNKLRLHKERAELAVAVQNAVETSRPLIEAQGHELSVTLPAEAIHVDADATRLAQVFSNLLNNAAKYTERGGRIWLTVGREDSEAVVAVKDTGVGIPAEHLPHIFEMFSQVDRSLERSQGGLGIGLSLVRGLVEMHGGRVEARSDGLDKGSEFVVRLPVADRQAAEHQPSVGRHAGTAAARCKVLVVDDNEDAATSLSMMLRIMGHDARTAHDGLQAVEAAESYRPDVVLLDIGLPKLNGYEVARRIRQQPWGKDVKLVALTGWGQEEDRRRAQEAGFDRHMVKPVEPAALEELLATFGPPPA